jgi:hypothetical protein
MGEAITGQWKRYYTAPFSGAEKWGTGINPVHQFYGESTDPARVYGRPAATGNTQAGGYGDTRQSFGKTPPYAASADYIETGAPWGYQPEDIAGLDVFQLSDFAANRHGMDIVNDTDHPNLGTGEGFNEPNRTQAGRYRVPLGVPGRFTSGRIRAGQWDADFEVSDQVPTETVSEGWINKLASGFDIGQSADDVVPSDPAQYERQTSMQQRHKTLNNDRAILRGTDEARTSIGSRIVPMKVKVYSGGQRHYDMFPFQIDDMPRPFWYRRAATGRPWELRPNEMYVTEPLQRTPPPDPSLGPPETSLSDPNYEPAYGYTSEDQGWF